MTKPKGIIGWLQTMRDCIAFGKYYANTYMRMPPKGYKMFKDPEFKKFVKLSRQMEREKRKKEWASRMSMQGGIR